MLAMSAVLGRGASLTSSGVLRLTAGLQQSCKTPTSCTAAQVHQMSM